MKALHLTNSEFREELLKEFKLFKVKIVGEQGDLILTEGNFIPVWSLCTWSDVTSLPIVSIGDASKKLRSLYESWHFLPAELHRRGELIAQQLSTPKNEAIPFPELLPKQDFATFTLWDKDTILYSLKTNRPFPGGLPKFIEDKTPPSRAYLKLWEAFCVAGVGPVAGNFCIDLGGAPGSWTWVMAKRGATVQVIDRAALDPIVSNLPNVSASQGDAFRLCPKDLPIAVDWLCSDLICTPEKLLELVEEWIMLDGAKNYICTLKLKGELNWSTVKKFQELGRVMHLHHNKHELTWIRLASEA